MGDCAAGKRLEKEACCAASLRVCRRAGVAKRWRAGVLACRGSVQVAYLRACPAGHGVLGVAVRLLAGKESGMFPGIRANIGIAEYVEEGCHGPGMPIFHRGPIAGSAVLIPCGDQFGHHALDVRRDRVHLQ